MLVWMHNHCMAVFKPVNALLSIYWSGYSKGHTICPLRMRLPNLKPPIPSVYLCYSRDRKLGSTRKTLFTSGFCVPLDASEIDFAAIMVEVKQCQPDFIFSTKAFAGCRLRLSTQIDRDDEALMQQLGRIGCQVSFFAAPPPSHLSANCWC